MFALVTIVSMASLLAQSAVDLTGTWSVQVEAARESTPDGGSRSRSALSLALVLEVRGMEVTGRFKSVVGDDVTLNGTWQDGKLDLTSPWREISITNNGRPATAKARWVIKGGLKGDVLGGTWDLQMGDSSLPQRWTARRRSDPESNPEQRPHDRAEDHGGHAFGGHDIGGIGAEVDHHGADDAVQDGDGPRRERRAARGSQCDRACGHIRRPHRRVVHNERQEDDVPRIGTSQYATSRRQRGGAEDDGEPPDEATDENHRGSRRLNPQGRADGRL